MAYNTFTDSDKTTLLNNPGVFYYRDYGSTGQWNKALFANGAKFAKSITTADIQFDDVGSVMTEVSDETAEISVSTARVLDLDFLGNISGGLMSVASTAGTPVSGASFVVNSGNWNFEKFIYLPGQNADGSKQTITSVVASVNGALALGTDYYQIKLPEVGWGIVVHDSTLVTTEAQSLTVTYGYTPAALKTLSTGGAKAINPLEIKFETYDSTGKLITYDFYKCYAKGNFGHGFSPENKSDPVTLDCTFSAKKDTTRTVGDQLFSVSRAQ